MVLSLSLIGNWSYWKSMDNCEIIADLAKIRKGCVYCEQKIGEKQEFNILICANKYKETF